MLGAFLVAGVALLMGVSIITSFVIESRHYKKVLGGPNTTSRPAPVREIDPAEVVRRIEKKQEREWVAEFESLLPKPEPEPIEYTNYCCCDTVEQMTMTGEVVAQARIGDPRCGVHRNPWE